jgi:hypothetical protein
MVRFLDPLFVLHMGIEVHPQRQFPTFHSLQSFSGKITSGTSERMEQLKAAADGAVATSLL